MVTLAVLFLEEVPLYCQLKLPGYVFNFTCSKRYFYHQRISNYLSVLEFKAFINQWKSNENLWQIGHMCNLWTHYLQCICNSTPLHIVYIRTSALCYTDHNLRMAPYNRFYVHPFQTNKLIFPVQLIIVITHVQNIEINNVSFVSQILVTLS